MASRTRAVVLYFLPFALVGGAFGFMYWYAWHSLPNSRGSPIRSYTIPGPKGSWVVLEDSLRMGNGNRGGISARGYRLSVLDAVTGQKVAQRIFENENLVACWPGRGAHLWCRAQEGLLNVELPSLVTRANVSTRFKGSGAHTLLRDQNRTGPGDLLLLYADGKNEVIDSETLEPRPAADDEGSLRNSAYEQCETSSYAKVPGGKLTFTEGPIHSLELETAKDPVGTPIEGAPTFLSREHLPWFIDVGDPSLLIITHDSSLDEATMVHRLSRVDARGEATSWTVDVGTGTCEHVALVARTLVMGRHDRELRAIAIDVDSGKVAWRFAFPPD